MSPQVPGNGGREDPRALEKPCSLIWTQWPSILYVLTPSVSFGSSFPCHSFHFSVPSFVRLTLTFLNTWPALSFPSTYCLCPPLHSLDIIVCICHNFSPNLDLSNENCTQKFPCFALPTKPFPTFHCRLRSAHGPATQYFIFKWSLVGPSCNDFTPKHSCNDFINSPSQLLFLGNGEF